MNYQNRGLFCVICRSLRLRQITQTWGFDNSWYHTKTEFNNCFIIHFSHNSSSETDVVQSLNSPFFPPHIGTEPGRAKEESRITCMRMLRTPPFFPPKSGEKPYLEIFSRFCLWRDFLITQATISAFRLNKNISINPKSVEFHQCHARPHSICFFITISKIIKEILPRFVVNWKHRLGLESARAALCKWVTCTRQTFLSKTSAKSLNIQNQYEKNVWEKSNDAYSLSIRVQTTIFYVFMFFTTISTPKKTFSFRARAEKGIARHIDVSGVVGT